MHLYLDVKTLSLFSRPEKSHIQQNSDIRPDAVHTLSTYELGGCGLAMCISGYNCPQYHKGLVICAAAARALLSTILLLNLLDPSWSDWLLQSVSACKKSRLQMYLLQMKLLLLLAIVLLLHRSCNCCVVREMCTAPSAPSLSQLFESEEDAVAFAKCHLACVDRVRAA